MRSERKFSHDQIEELKEAARTHQKAYLRVRALAIYHVSQGMSFADAASMILAHRTSVSTWTRSYLAEGLSGLEIEKGRGRTSEVTADEIAHYLRQSPRAFGILRSRWTLEALAQVVPCLKGFSANGVMEALKRHGFGYKRGQPYLHSPDPDYEAKKGQWIKL